MGGIIQFLVLLWACTPLALGGILEDYRDKITVCHHTSCMDSVAARFADSGELIVLTVTYSVEYDGYLPLYCGWIMEMLEHVPYHLVYFDVARMILGVDRAAAESADYVVDATNTYVSQCALCDSNGTHCPACADYPMLKDAAFSFNPERLAMVIIRDAEFRMELCNYRYLREARGLRVPILFHLNDEMPWEHNKVCDPSVILDTYASAPLTLRNYYFDDTNARALYFPLGAGRMSYNKRLKANVQILREHPNKASSERSFICSFAGRRHYKEDYSDGALERAQFMAEIQALHEGDGPSCYSVFSDMDDAFVARHGLDFNTYFNVMRESIFAPCPGGNNPETFRHYEALEVGSVPLLVRIKRPERDFLSTWEGYPGPIFESWAELGPFLRGVNGSYANALQRDVMAWYAAFKERHREEISRAVRRALEGGPAQTQAEVQTGAQAEVHAHARTEAGGISGEGGGGELKDELRALRAEVALLARRLAQLEGRR